MAVILGINAFHADASAVLLKDGQLVGAIAEERLNRVKHFAGFPRLAILKLLEMGGLTVRDIDHIAIGRDGRANLLDKLTFSLKNLSRISKLARQRLENRAHLKDIVALVAEATGVDDIKAKVHNVEHHLCHAASTYLPSGFERAAILTIDGFGDFASTMTAVGEGDRFRVLDRILFPHSLGIFYSAICQFIGYDKYGDEGKVMGLAPYGKPRYLDLMREIVQLEDDGRFALDLDWFIHHSEGVDYGTTDDGHPTLAPLYSGKLAERLGPARQRGTEISERDMDLAHSMQARFEEVYFHILRHLQRQTGLDALCVAGGVALNSVGNGKIFQQTGFRRFYAHPAAGDDGTAFGAAYFVHHLTLGAPRGPVLDHAYFGNAYSDVEIGAALGRAGLLADAVLLDEDALCQQAAEQVAAGKVVGWFQGRMEWGPRALGARSIVAHPGLPDMKDTLNSRIKHREWFRPFAPAILEERVGDYFTETHPSPFMMLVYPTRPRGREDIQATDHVDHTGRLQTVSRSTGRYYKLIEAFERITKIPVILNTSFNENEPIVCTPDEAIDCFVRTRMDALAIGGYLVVKHD